MAQARRHYAVHVPALIGGGAERVAALLASELRAVGHDVTLVADFDAPENRASVGTGVRYVVLGGRHHRSLLRLAGFLGREQPDLALAVGASANVKLVLAHMLARPRTRLVLSYHGRSTVGRGLLGSAGYALAPFLARYAARTVCVSEDLVAHLTRDWHVPYDRVARIYNPVAIDRAQPAESAAALKARPPVVVGMGRLAPEKDFASLVAAMAMLPHSDARLVLFGAGPERDALRALADRLGIGARVDLPGYVADPWQAYAAARCFALSSTSEAFGNVVVEALASGLPVVVTASGGPAEIVEQGRYGRVVPVGDPAALARAIGAALDDPGDPRPRIERARMFHMRRIVGHYATLFDEILGTPASAAPPSAAEAAPSAANGIQGAAMMRVSEKPKQVSDTP